MNWEGGSRDFWQAVNFMYWSTSNLYTDNTTSSSLTVTCGALIQKGEGHLFRGIIGGTTRKSVSVAIFWEDVLSTGGRIKGKYSLFLGIMKQILGLLMQKLVLFIPVQIAVLMSFFG